MSNFSKTAACYIRVSTNKQEELSPDSQLEEIKKFANQNGYILPAEFIFTEEEGISGKRADNRKEFQRMISCAKQKPKPFDAILVWKFSRFARNQDESTFYKGMLRKKCGIDVISISEPIMDGMYGRLIEMIIEWSDEFYSINLSGEVMRGMTEKAKRGGYQSGVPFGYNYDKTTKTVSIVPEEALVVKKIFDWFCNPDMPIREFEISKKLNEAGYKTRFGNPFEIRTVRYILENPFYIGKIRWNRQHHETHTIKEKDNWIVSDGNHEPLITDEQFSEAQKLLAQRARAGRTRPVSSKHWLSGLLKCGDCGSSLFVNCPSSDGSTNFQCGNYIKGKCQKSHSVNEKAIKRSIVDTFNSFIVSDKIDYKVVEREDYDAEVALLQRALENVKLKEERAKKAYIAGVDTLEEYQQNKALLGKEKEDIEKRLLPYTFGESSDENDEAAMKAYRQKLKDVLAIIENTSSSNEQLYESIRSVVEKIVFTRDENHRPNFDFFMICYK